MSATVIVPNQLVGVTILEPIEPPTSAETAGKQGQIAAGVDGNLYFCSVTGVAGSATWNKLSMTVIP